MKTIALETLDAKVRNQLMDAISGPIVITEQDRPMLVVRSIVDDESADDLIAEHPAFLDTIQRAREDKRKGRVRHLAELRARYDAGEESQG